MGGDTPRAKIVIVVERGSGFVCARLVSISAVLVSDIRDEALEFGLGFKVAFGHWITVQWVVDTGLYA
jgi:hypothetical protein